MRRFCRCPLLAAATLLASALAGCRGTGAVPEVRAHRFVLEDADGRARTVLETSAIGGTPEISLLDAEGEARARILLGPDGSPRIALVGADGQERLVAALGGGASPRLELRDSSGVRRLGAGLHPDGNVALILSDPHGKERLNLGVSPRGAPRVTLQDSSERVRSAWQVREEDQTPLFSLRGPDGEHLCSLEIVKTIEGAALTGLTFRDAANLPRLFLGTREDGSTLLHLGDRDHSCQAMIQAAPGATARIGVQQEEGAPSSALEIDGAGSARLALSGRGEARGATLEAPPEGPASLELRDSGAALKAVGGPNPRVSLHAPAASDQLTLGLGEEGHAELLVRDRAGSVRAQLGVTPEGTAFLGLRDAEGRSREEMQVRPDGSPHFGMRDAQEVPRAWIGLDAEDAPELSLRAASGETIARLPR